MLRASGRLCPRSGHCTVRHANPGRSRRGSTAVFISITSTLTGKTRNWLTQGATALGMGLVYFLACHVALSIDVTNGWLTSKGGTCTTGSAKNS